MRRPVGVAILWGFAMVICDDGAVFTASSGKNKWVEDEPIPGTPAATTPISHQSESGK